MRKKKAQGASQWSPRLAGVLLCAFFFLGVMTGFSEPGRRLALRAKCLVASWTGRLMTRAEPVGNALGALRQSIEPLQAMIRPGRRSAAAPAVARGTGFAVLRPRENAVALVKRNDGFYALYSGGDLRGPLSPASQSDLPILSGPGAQNADGAALVDDAAVLVRAEAQMQSMVSEMRLGGDRTASLFLDRSQMEIALDLDSSALELRRALEVLKQWQGREQHIAMVDMTTPGMAVVRLRTELPKMVKRQAPAPKAHARAGVRRIRIAERAR